MKKMKKLIILALACTMIFGSALSAQAAVRESDLKVNYVLANGLNVADATSSGLFEFDGQYVWTLSSNVKSLGGYAYLGLIYQIKNEKCEVSTYKSTDRAFAKLTFDIYMNGSFVTRVSQTIYCTPNGQITTTAPIVVIP